MIVPPYGQVSDYAQQEAPAATSEPSSLPSCLKARLWLLRLFQEDYRELLQ